VRLETLIGEPWADYGLVDSGNGRKLERYGRFRFVRPEPQAMWAPARPDWQAHGEFVPGSDEEGGGRWSFREPVPREGWPLAWHEARFTAQATPFRHLGFFPDMAPVWSWMRDRIAPVEAPECLRMVHVDASKKSVEAARGNARLSGLGDAPVRWIVEDAAKFVSREVRRGRRYDGIILDPPKFGRGPEGEVWRLEQDLAPLIADCRRLLDADSRFLFLTVYAVRMSALAIGELVRQAFADLPGEVEAGELGVREEARGLVLPTAIWTRWRR
jgi:23S rRNA (cytosine1962-C5)-methyltransferase